jgi:hypothetical protein
LPLLVRSPKSGTISLALRFCPKHQGVHTAVRLAWAKCVDYCGGDALKLDPQLWRAKSCLAAGDLLKWSATGTVAYREGAIRLYRELSSAPLFKGGDHAEFGPCGIDGPFSDAQLQFWRRQLVQLRRPDGDWRGAIRYPDNGQTFTVSSGSLTDRCYSMSEVPFKSGDEYSAKFQGDDQHGYTGTTDCRIGDCLIRESIALKFEADHSSFSLSRGA